MKRAAVRSSIGGDFKRLKAKVGKKAPQRINETQTKFQSSSVHVQSQVDSFSKKKSSSASNNDDGKSEELTSSLQLISGKGNTVEYLLHQVGHHPSPVSRLSALKGVLDAIQRCQKKQQNKNNSNSALVANLSILIPGISKCLVDENDSIRLTCLMSFRALYDGLLLQSSSCERTAADGVILLRPFLPLHVAYLTSALNSLNGSIRLDAARCVLILTCAFPRALGSYGNDNRSSGTSSAEGGGMLGMNLLPAFSRLLGNRGSGSATPSGGVLVGTGTFGGVLQKEKQKAQQQSKKNNKKNASRQQKAKDRKQTDAMTIRSTAVGDIKNELMFDFGNDKDDSIVVLQSFLSLLRSIVSFTLQENHNGRDGVDNSLVSMLQSDHIQEKDLVFTVGSGGHASNAYLLFRGDNKKTTERASSRHPVSIHGMDDILSSLSVDNLMDDGGSNVLTVSSPPGVGAESPLSLSLCVIILTQLRNSWIETTQKGTAHGSKYFVLSPRYMPEAYLILQALSLFWKGFVTPLYCVTSSPPREVVSIVNNWQTLLMEALPVRDESGITSKHNEQTYQDLNSNLCCLLVDIAQTTAVDDQQDEIHRPKRKKKHEIRNEAWIARVMDYIMPRLDDCITAITGGDEKDDSDGDDLEGNKVVDTGKKRNSNTFAPYSGIPITVISQLLLVQTKHINSSCNSKWYLGLLYKFVQIFFLVPKITTAKALLVQTVSPSAKLDIDCTTFQINNHAVVLGCRLVMLRMEQFQKWQQRKKQVSSSYPVLDDQDDGFWRIHTRRNDAQDKDTIDSELKIINRSRRMDKNVQTIAICLPIVILHSMQGWIRINSFIRKQQQEQQLNVTTNKSKNDSKLAEIKLVAATTLNIVCKMMDLVMNLVRKQSSLPSSVLLDEGKERMETSTESEDNSMTEELEPKQQHPLILFWNNLQIMMEALVMTPNTKNKLFKSKKHKLAQAVAAYKVSTGVQKTHYSILEQMPESMQCSMIGLLGLMSTTSTTRINFTESEQHQHEIDSAKRSLFQIQQEQSLIRMVCFLSQVCSRTNDGAADASFGISATMASYIVTTMHTLRKSMAIKGYVTFLIRSCDVPPILPPPRAINHEDVTNNKFSPEEKSFSDKRANNNKDHINDTSTLTNTRLDLDWNIVFSRDAAVCRMCRSLIMADADADPDTNCNNNVLLLMMQPVLMDWLDTSGLQTTTMRLENNSTTTTLEATSPDCYNKNDHVIKCDSIIFMRFRVAVLVLASCSIGEHTSSADSNSSANGGGNIWNSVAQSLCNILSSPLLGGAANNNSNDDGSSNHQKLSETLGNRKEKLLLPVVALLKCEGALWSPLLIILTKHLRNLHLNSDSIELSEPADREENGKNADLSKSSSKYTAVIALPSISNLENLMSLMLTIFQSVELKERLLDQNISDMIQTMVSTYYESKTNNKAAATTSHLLESLMEEMQLDIKLRMKHPS